jgi:hypothetical protein
VMAEIKGNVSIVIVRNRKCTSCWRHETSTHNQMLKWRNCWKSSYTDLGLNASVVGRPLPGATIKEFVILHIMSQFLLS